MKYSLLSILSLFWVYFESILSLSEDKECKKQRGVVKYVEKAAHLNLK